MLLATHVITFTILTNILIDFTHQGKEKDHQKRQTDDIKVVVKVMQIRNWRTVAKDQKDWWRTVLEAKVHNLP